MKLRHILGLKACKLHIQPKTKSRDSVRGRYSSAIDSSTLHQPQSRADTCKSCRRVVSLQPQQFWRQTLKIRQHARRPRFRPWLDIKPNRCPCHFSEKLIWCDISAVCRTYWICAVKGRNFNTDHSARISIQCSCRSKVPTGGFRPSQSNFWFGERRWFCYVVSLVIDENCDLYRRGAL